MFVLFWSGIEEKAYTEYCKKRKCRVEVSQGAAAEKSKRKAPFAGSFRLSCFSDYLVSVVSIVVSSIKFALLANFLTDSIADSAAALDL